MRDKERNHRAVQALMGLILVSGTYMMYLSGKIEASLVRVTETWYSDEQSLAESDS